MSDLLFPVSLPCLRLESRVLICKTSVQEADSGPEFRVGHYSGPRYRYSFRLSTRDNQAERVEIEGFFISHGGMRDSFLLVDPVDSVTRRVRFDDDSLEMERLASGVYATSFDLVSVVS